MFKFLNNIHWATILSIAASFTRIMRVSLLCLGIYSSAELLFAAVATLGLGYIIADWAPREFELRYKMTTAAPVLLGTAVILEYPISGVILTILGVSASILEQYATKNVMRAYLSS